MARTRHVIVGGGTAGINAITTIRQYDRGASEIIPGSSVVMVGAGFIAFTILNAILSHGAKLSVVEIAPQILPRMIDPQGAQVVEQWLRDRGVATRTNARLQAIEDT